MKKPSHAWLENSLNRIETRVVAIGDEAALDFYLCVRYEGSLPRQHLKFIRIMAYNSGEILYVADFGQKSCMSIGMANAGKWFVVACRERLKHPAPVLVWEGIFVRNISLSTPLTQKVASIG